AAWAAPRSASTRTTNCSASSTIRSRISHLGTNRYCSRSWLPQSDTVVLMGDKIVDNPVAVLGLGEAGAAIAGDLAAAGVDVRGYDPVEREVEGVKRSDSAAAAAGGAALVM